LIVIWLPRNHPRNINFLPRSVPILSASSIAERDGTMSTRIGILLVLAGLLLSACGTNPGDRAGSGALIGAAGGAAIGAMVGAPLQGAAIGAGAGALTGAATSPNTIYLGKPAWEQ
jgi:osmotically inducible lipoprotein OsmB